MLTERSVLALQSVGLVVALLALVLPYWTFAHHHSSSYGPFYKLSDDHVRFNRCLDDMGNTTCALLRSSKVSGILSLLLGIFSVAVLMVYKRVNLRVFYSFLLGFLQIIFAIICIVFFSLFSKSYMTIDDDINHVVKVNGTYYMEAGFYLWVLHIVMAAAFVGVSAKALFDPKSNK